MPSETAGARRDAAAGPKKRGGTHANSPQPTHRSEGKTPAAGTRYRGNRPLCCFDSRLHPPAGRALPLPLRTPCQRGRFFAAHAALRVMETHPFRIL